MNKKSFVHERYRTPLVKYVGKLGGVLLPYIKKEGPTGREHWDPLIQPLIEDLKKLPPEEVDGVINYVVTRMLKNTYPARYYHYNKAIGVLECIKQEFYRRVVSTYEDKKILENGDVE